MPDLTPRLGIKKPRGNETVTRASLNENWDIIDQNATPQSEFDDHRSAGVLDHPDGSVTTAKLADGAVTSGKMAAGAATDAAIGTRTINDASAPNTDTGSPTNLWSWLAYMIKAITGKSSWRTTPATTLEAAKSHMDATTGVHGATSAATPNTLVQRDSAGRFKAAAPSASDDVARKAEVDAVANSTVPQSAVRGFLGQTIILPEFSDYDELTTPGLYHTVYYDPKQHEPFTGAGPRRVTLEVREVLGNDIIQRLTYEDGVGKGRQYFRFFNPNSPSHNWHMVWSTGNGIVQTEIGGPEVIPNFLYGIDLEATWAPEDVQGKVGLLHANGGTKHLHYHNGTGWNVVWHSGNNPANIVLRGYQKLASGLILQWGYDTITSGSTTFTLPIAYPTAHLATIPVAESSNPDLNITAGSFTLTQFTAWANDTNPVPIRWFSVGV